MQESFCEKTHSTLPSFLRERRTVCGGQRNDRDVLEQMQARARRLTTSYLRHASHSCHSMARTWLRDLWESGHVKPEGSSHVSNSGNVVCCSDLDGHSYDSLAPLCPPPPQILPASRQVWEKMIQFVEALAFPPSTPSSRQEKPNLSVWGLGLDRGPGWKNEKSRIQNIVSSAGDATPKMNEGNSQIVRPRFGQRGETDAGRHGSKRSQHIHDPGPAAEQESQPWP